MNDICIRDLADIVGGRLQLGTMPPLGGQLEPIDRIVVGVDNVCPGDVVFLAYPGKRDARAIVAEEAFARGALGVVGAGPRVEPWAGKFSLWVDDAKKSLLRLASWARRRFAGRMIFVTGGQLAELTAHMIDRVLARKWSGILTIENGQSETTLALLSLSEHHRYAVVAGAGTSRRDVLPLAELCCPHIAVMLGPGAATGQRQVVGARPQPAELAILGTLPDNGVVVLDRREETLRLLAEKHGVKVLVTDSDRDRCAEIRRVEHRDETTRCVINGIPVVVPGVNDRGVTVEDLQRSLRAAFAVGRCVQMPPADIVSALEQLSPRVDGLDVAAAI